MDSRRINERVEETGKRLPPSQFKQTSEGSMNHLTTTNNYDAIKTRGPKETKDIERRTPCCDDEFGECGAFNLVCPSCGLPYFENGYGEPVSMEIDEVMDRLRNTMHAEKIAALMERATKRLAKETV